MKIPDSQTRQGGFLKIIGLKMYGLLVTKRFDPRVLRFEILFVSQSFDRIFFCRFPALPAYS